MVSLLVRQASKKHKKDLRSLGTSWLNLGHASLLSEDQTLLHIFVSGLVGLKQATVSSAAARLCTLRTTSSALHAFETELETHLPRSEDHTNQFSCQIVSMKLIIPSLRYEKRVAKGMRVPRR